MKPKSVRPGQTHTDIWLSYVAGYLDADGCFRWNRTPEVSATNVFPYTLYQLKESFGGSVRSYKNAPDGRTYYQWRSYGDGALQVVHLILPYLWEKLPQAELLLSIRAEEPGAKRSGLIRQLRSLKQIDYGEKGNEG